MSTDGKIAPIRGLPWNRPFSDVADLTKTLAECASGYAKDNGALPDDHEPSTDELDQLKGVSAPTFLSGAGTQIFYDQISQSDDPEAWAVWLGAAKVLADHRCRSRRVNSATSSTDDAHDVRGDPVLDQFQNPLDCGLTDNEAKNKARLETAGVGIMVEVDITETQRAWGDMLDPAFGSTRDSPVLKKRYVGVVSEINERSFEVNTLQTVGGKGFDGLARDQHRYFVRVMAEGSEYQLADQSGTCHTSKNIRPPEIFFTRGRPARNNGLIELRSKTIGYKDLISIVSGRFTEESTVRFQDRMEASFLLQDYDFTRAAGLSQSVVDRLRIAGRPASGRCHQVDGNVIRVVERWAKSQDICKGWNNGGCNSRICRDGYQHLCSDCHGLHRRCGWRPMLEDKVHKPHEPDHKRKPQDHLQEARSKKQKHADPDEFGFRNQFANTNKNSDDRSGHYAGEDRNESVLRDWQLRDPKRTFATSTSAPQSLDRRSTRRDYDGYPSTRDGQDDPRYEDFGRQTQRGGRPRSRRTDSYRPDHYH